MEGRIEDENLIANLSGKLNNELVFTVRRSALHGLCDRNKPVQPFLFIALPQGMLGRVKGHMFLLGLYGNIAQP